VLWQENFANLFKKWGFVSIFLFFGLTHSFFWNRLKTNSEKVEKSILVGKPYIYVEVGEGPLTE
jgi:hypothetical protein